MRTLLRHQKQLIVWSLLSGVFFFASVLLLPACAPKPAADSESVAGSPRYLYVSSGICYSGTGNTTFTNLTSSNVVYRINLSTGQKETTIADYFSSPSNTGDSPVGLANIDSNWMYVLVENSTTTSLRRIEKVAKSDHGGRTTFSNNTTALSAVLRDLVPLSGGDLLISKSSGIEYITSSNARIGAPFINPSTAPCASSNTLISKFIVLGSGRVAFIHAAASQNRIGILPTTGGTACTTVQAAPTAAAYPVAMAYDAANTRLIVAYSGNATTTDINSIYVYTVDETTAAISGAQKIYDASLYPATYPYLLYGISEMVFDSATNSLYIATAISNATTVVNYSIEKFAYNAAQIGVDNTKVLTRSGNVPFYSYGSDTKCISSMMISN